MWKFEADFQRVYTYMVIEANRIKIVAFKEQYETDIQLDESDAKWDLEVFANGANVMAAIGGGTTHSQGQKSSKVMSAVGGAMGGAAAGAATGAAIGASSTGPYAPVGALIGAVIGGIGGYLAG
jgi:hypothetical protein